jgi:hypothetical protein
MPPCLPGGLAARAELFDLAGCLACERGEADNEAALRRLALGLRLFGEGLAAMGAAAGAYPSAAGMEMGQIYPDTKDTSGEYHPGLAAAGGAVAGAAMITAAHDCVAAWIFNEAF